MDLLLLRRLLAELAAAVPGCRVEQAYAIPRHHVALVLALPGRPRLWFAAEAQEPHLYLRHGPHDAPVRPPGFAMALRKAARGRTVASIRQLGDDRVVELRFCSTGTRLLLELIPRRATAYLLDAEGRVAAVWMPRRGRPRPGEPYRLPAPARRRSLPAISDTEWRAWGRLDERALRRRLVAELAGMTALVAREVTVRGEAAAPLAERVEMELSRAAAAPTHALVYLGPGATTGTDRPEPIALAPYPLAALAASPARAFPSLIAAAAYYYPARAQARWAASTRAALAAALRTGRARLERALQRLEADTESADPDALRRRADLLLAFPHAPREGNAVVLPDLEGSGQVVVPLAPGRGPIQEAQQLYRRARRLEQARAHARRRRQEIVRRIEGYRALELRVAGAAPGQLAACEREAAVLGVGGWSRPAGDAEIPPAHPGGTATDRAARRRAARPPAGILELELAGGHRVWIGRSATANDLLTRRLARSYDWWLHADAPGSHVVLRNPRRLPQPPPDALAAAAALAAWFSKARGSDTVEVRWTRAADVRRPKGAPPGRALLGHHRTLQVRPRPPAELAVAPRDGDLRGPGER